MHTQDSENIPDMVQDQQVQTITGVSVFLTHPEFETRDQVMMSTMRGDLMWLPWGLLITPASLMLTGWREGAIAEDHADDLRKCIGMVLTECNHPVYCADDVVAAAKGCTSVSLRFSSSAAITRQ